ncbi:hypothetical protein LTR66_016444, partial [Elasticomyces elasticus]
MAQQSSSVVHEVYEPKTGSWQYIVADPKSKAAVIIDPVLDYDSATGSIATTSADSLLSIVHQQDYYI